MKVPRKAPRVPPGPASFAVAASRRRFVGALAAGPSAMISNLPEPLHTSGISPKMCELVAEYGRCDAASDHALINDLDNYDDLAVDLCDALWAIIAHPVSTMEELLRKIELIEKEDQLANADVTPKLVADVRRLADVVAL